MPTDKVRLEVKANDTASNCPVNDETVFVTVPSTEPLVLLPEYSVSVTDPVVADPFFIVKFPPPKRSVPLATVMYQLLV